MAAPEGRIEVDPSGAILLKNLFHRQLAKAREECLEGLLLLGGLVSFALMPDLDFR